MKRIIIGLAIMVSLALGVGYVSAQPAQPNEPEQPEFLADVELQPIDPPFGEQPVEVTVVVEWENATALENWIDNKPADVRLEIEALIGMVPVDDRPVAIKHIETAVRAWQDAGLQAEASKWGAGATVERAENGDVVITVPKSEAMHE